MCDGGLFFLLERFRSPSFLSSCFMPPFWPTVKTKKHPLPVALAGQAGLPPRPRGGPAFTVSLTCCVVMTEPVHVEKRNASVCLVLLGLRGLPRTYQVLRRKRSSQNQILAVPLHLSSWLGFSWANLNTSDVFFFVFFFPLTVSFYFCAYSL